MARGPALQRAAYLMVGDAQLAQDLVQEALTKTYLAWPRLRDPGKAEAYCRKAITTTALNWFSRKGWNNERPTEHLPDAATTPLDGVPEQSRIRAALQALPPRQRASIVLRYFEDLSEPQTADVLGCAVGTVKSQVAAALEKLRALLGDEVELPTHDQTEVIR